MTFLHVLIALASVVLGFVARMLYEDWRDRREQTRLFADAIAEADAKRALAQPRNAA